MVFSPVIGKHWATSGEIPIVSLPLPTVSEAWPQTDEACYPYPETRAQLGVWEARKHPPSCGTMNRAPCAVFGLPASGPSPTRQPPLLGTQRRRCCYGMPAAALLMRQGNERWVAYRFLPPNAVQVVAHILAVSPFSTFDPRLPQEGGEFQIRLARLLPGILSTVHCPRMRK